MKVCRRLAERADRSHLLHVPEHGPSFLATDCWVITSSDGGATWSGKLRLTASSFDGELAPLAGSLTISDYEGLAQTGNSFVAANEIGNTRADPTDIQARPSHPDSRRRVGTAPAVSDTQRRLPTSPTARACGLTPELGGVRARAATAGGSRHQTMSKAALPVANQSGHGAAVAPHGVIQ